jgi:RNA polymerase sigma-70 factor (ECF subfamily)
MTLAPRQPSFETTHWSLVLTAGADASSDARRALTTLCETYWYPLYAYVRRQGYQAEDAQDLTQGFFARFLEKHDVRSARRTRGRFRSFLLASMKHFLLNEVAHRRRLKRGGGHTHCSRWTLTAPKAGTCANSLTPTHRRQSSTAIGRARC